MKNLPRLAYLAAVLPWGVLHAQSAPATSDNSVTLGSIKVEASADASAAGLAPAFDGGQVATGSRAGILGTRDNLETPFSMTSYTSELIKDRQARSVPMSCKTILACAWRVALAISRNHISCVVFCLARKTSPITVSMA